MAMGEVIDYHMLLSLIHISLSTHCVQTQTSTLTFFMLMTIPFSGICAAGKEEMAGVVQAQKP